MADETTTPKRRRHGPLPRVDKDTVAKALRAHAGNMSAAAKGLKLARVTVWKYVRRSKELQELVEELTEEKVDLAEGALVKLLKNPKHTGHTQAVLFVLKTQGRKRGYTDRTEIVGPAEGDTTAGPVKATIYLPAKDPEDQPLTVTLPPKDPE